MPGVSPHGRKIKRDKENEGGLLVQLKAMLVGNSDGIGLSTTRRLLAVGWDIIGVSRSESPIASATYHHRVADVSDNEYSELIDELVLALYRRRIDDFGAAHYGGGYEKKNEDCSESDFLDTIGKSAALARLIVNAEAGGVVGRTRFGPQLTRAV